MDDPYQGPQCQCDTSCQNIVDPVCDTDGNTHVNECALKAVSCQLQKKITMAYKGTCQGNHCMRWRLVLGTGSMHNRGCYA